MIVIAAVIAAAIAAGHGAERRLGERADHLAALVMRAMLWGLVPVVVFLNVASLELTARVGIGIGFGYVSLAASIGAAYVLGRHVLRLSRPSVGSLMLAAGLANTGYLGLPFNAALLGQDDLPTAVAYDFAVSVIGLVTIGFSIGAAFGSIGGGPRERAKAFVTRNPPLWACVAGAFAPDAVAQGWVLDLSHVLVYSLLPLGFFVVGVTLAREAAAAGLRFPPRLTRPVLLALGLRLLLAPAIVLVLSTVVLEVPDAYLVQAGMACGINGIVIAHEFGLDRALAAGAIAWSTTIVVIAGLVVSLA